MTRSQQASSRWLKILHRIGYVTTALVAAQLLFLAYMIVPEWWTDLQRDRAQRERTQTHVGRLAQHIDDDGPGETLLLLGALPRNAGVGRDALRIIIKPSLQDRAYVLALDAGPGPTGRATAEMATIRWDECGGQQVRRAFTLAPSEYRNFIKWFDQKTENYTGSAEGVLDGTSVAFERRKNGEITSGAGNIPSHYGQLAARLLTLLKPHVSGADIPTDSSWHDLKSNWGCPS
jgi:hypothetical protein